MRWPMLFFFMAVLIGSAVFADQFALAQEESENDRSRAALATSQSAIGREVSGLSFTHINGSPVSIEAYRGKPLIISMIYTSCADVCPTIIQSLHGAVDVAREALGTERFNVITIGFDTANDTPNRMRSFAAARGINLSNWDFLAADAENLDRLAELTGFTFKSFAGGFEHMAQITLLNADGKIFGQLYGSIFDPPVVVEPLKDLVFGTYRPVASLEGLIDRIKLFCTVYNPNTGRYYFNYSLFIGAAIGFLCLLSVLSWLVREYRRSSPGHEA